MTTKHKEPPWVRLSHFIDLLGMQQRPFAAEFTEITKGNPSIGQSMVSKLIRNDQLPSLTVAAWIEHITRTYSERERKMLLKGVDEDDLAAVKKALAPGENRVILCTDWVFYGK